MINFIKSLFGGLAFIPGLVLVVVGCMLPQLGYDEGDTFPWIRYIIGSLLVVIGSWPIAKTFHIPNFLLGSLVCLGLSLICMFPLTGGLPIEIITKSLAVIFFAIIGMGITNES